MRADSYSIIVILIVYARERCVVYFYVHPNQKAIDRSIDLEVAIATDDDDDDDVTRDAFVRLDRSIHRLIMSHAAADAMRAAPTAHTARTTTTVRGATTREVARARGLDVRGYPLWRIDGSIDIDRGERSRA